MLLRLLARAAAADSPVAVRAAVPLAAARLVSQRWLGLVEVPTALEQALEQTSAEFGSEKGRQLNNSSRRLLQGLRRNARTASRGGVNALPAMDPDSGLRARPKRGKRSAQQMMRELRQGPIASVDDEEEGGGSPDECCMPANPDELSSGAGGKTSPAYDAVESAAYAASRFPATYSVLRKIMEELRMRLPDFQPTRMLDFGSGPGTAIWAASSVWGAEALEAVHAVEKSAPMLALAHGCWQALRASDASTPSVRWSRKLAPRPSDARLASQRYDLVVASYVLAELRSPAERRRVVQSLWERTRGVLLLVEPGTPVGSANVREARTQVLAAERRGSGGLAASAESGAHVTAPCPGDGGCPMDGTTAWCHFVQRFQRTAVQKRIKALPGGARPRDYQDERFSYVALRRGPRPEEPARIRLSVPGRAPGVASEQELSDEEQLAEESDAEEEVPVELNTLQPDAETLKLILESIRDGADDSDEEEAAEAEACAQAVVRDLQRPRAAAPTQPRLPATAAQPRPSAAAGGGRQDGVPTTDTRLAGGAAGGGAMEAGEAALVGEGGQAELLRAEEEEDDAPTASSDEIAAAVAASGAWSRVIRPPRKKSGHVVLDLCSAGGNSEGKARLEQQVVSRASSRLGAPLYRAARKVRWGDLWPSRAQWRGMCGAATTAAR